MIGMACTGYTDTTKENEGGRRSSNSGGAGSGQGTGAEAPRRSASMASCKMCQHVEVCKAYEAALLANDQFARMTFLRIDTPIIVPNRLAERCTKYTPPNKTEIAEAVRHELR